MPNGAFFVFESKKDAEPTFASMPTENGVQRLAISPTSNTGISENQDVSTDFAENSQSNRSATPDSAIFYEQVQIVEADEPPLSQEEKRHEVVNWARASLRTAGILFADEQAGIKSYL